MTARTAISVTDYLGTAFERAPDYLQGELVERSMPGTWHSRIQSLLVAAAAASGERSGLFAYPEIHLPVAPDRWRIADLAFYVGEAEAPYPQRVALGIVEIVSPRDAHHEVLDRLRDYHAWGVPNIWLVDPEFRTIHRYDGANLLAVDAIEFADPLFRLAAADLFKGIR